MQVVPSLSIEDGIQASRKVLQKCYFDHRCEPGIDALREYQREWDDDRKMFKDHPLHNWTSHASDGFRYLAVAYQLEKLPREQQDPKFDTDRSFSKIVELSRKRRLRGDD